MLLQRLNANGRIFITHTKLGEDYCLRLVPGNEQVDWPDVEEAWQLIQNEASIFYSNHK
jgi:aromatic-L-amino-acid decarboxylase